MTIPEACQLVLQAAAVGSSGDTMVLDMGEPIRISDVARTLVEQSGKDIEIVYTGLRANEKLCEELFDHSETPTRGLRHESLAEVRVAPFNELPKKLDQIDDHARAKTWMAENVR
jgi:FlaA1/EpsC-like NDP-sugar epimerase